MRFSFNTIVFPLSMSLIPFTVAASPLSFGNVEQKMGQLEISGWLRANIQNKSYSDEEHKLKFDAAKLALKYQRDKFEGNFEYRCYQFDKLCDFSSLVDANIRYQFSPNHLLQVGVQEIPFGPARSWSSNWYGGILVNMGLEDVHNLGIKYQYPIGSTQLEFAYFTGDAGSYTGKSRDAARYSANLVQTDSAHSQLEEKNMWLMRAQHQWTLDDAERLNLNLGGSYWLSEIKNKSNQQSGERKSWALFGQLDYKPLKITLTGGHNDINNHDPIFTDSSMFGSFDMNYAVANKGYFYTADLLYSFALANDIQISPYATFSQLQKSTLNSSDSTRYILGTQLDYKSISLIGEYIISKNDAFVGGNTHSFAQGDPSASHNNLFNLIFLYKF